jgi:small subunit ribosomal protein S4
LDNVVYRLGWGVSRKEARQLVRHGHFLVNGKKVNIPSFLVKTGDEITVKATSLSSVKLKQNLEDAASKSIPEWIDYNATTYIAKIKALPTREQIDIPVQEHLIVELYSR